MGSDLVGRDAEIAIATGNDTDADGDTLTYEVEADGFLRRMVRSLVGGLIAAGRGVMDDGALRQALEARDRRAWPPPAAARGLTLVRVDYPPEVAPVLP